MRNEPQIDKLKDEYIRYFEDVPIQKYAAMYILRNEDTIIRWKNSDKEFAYRVDQAKAKWVRKMLIKTKAEFALERLEKQLFNSPSIEPPTIALVQFIGEEND